MVPSSAVTSTLIVLSPDIKVIVSLGCPLETIKPLTVTLALSSSNTAVTFKFVTECGTSAV